MESGKWKVEALQKVVMIFAIGAGILFLGILVFGWLP